MMVRELEEKKEKRFLTPFFRLTAPTDNGEYTIKVFNFDKAVTDGKIRIVNP